MTGPSSPGVALTVPQAERDPVRARVRTLFEFLRRFDERRSPTRRNISDTEWRLFFSEVPRHHSVTANQGIRPDAGGEESGPLLSIRKPKTTDCPVPPSSLEGWLHSGWMDPANSPEILPERASDTGNIERFDEDKQRSAAAKTWLELREAWATEERSARASLALFNRCLALWARLQREGEALKLLLGDGLLIWAPMDDKRGLVRHPLLLVEVELRFDEKQGELSFVETSAAPFLYSELLSSFEGLDGNVRAACRRLVNKAAEEGTCHPLGGAETVEILAQLGHLLSAADGLLPGAAEVIASETPRIQRNPVIFVIPRQSGVRGACEAFLQKLDSLASLPIGVKLVVGGATNLVGRADRAEALHPDGQDAESCPLYFTKPANDAQERIARRLHSAGAVLVQGPPGTGKTHTIANLIGHLLAQGKSVLVTAQTSKALKVLRSQVVDELKPLCVSVLDSDLESRSELQHAVNGMVAKLTSSAEQLDEQAASCAAERKRIEARIDERARELRLALSAEIEDIVVAGQGIHPSEAARMVAAGVSRHDWVPGPVEASAPLPLSEAELAEVYRLNGAIRPADEQCVLAGLPDDNSLIEVEDFRAVVEQLAAPMPPIGKATWQGTSSANTATLRQLQNCVLEAVRGLDSSPAWFRACISDGLIGGERQKAWKEFTACVEAATEDIAGAKRRLADFKLEVDATLAPEEAMVSLEQMMAHVAAGGGLSWFARIGHKDWTRMLEGVKVNERPPRTFVELERAKDFFAVSMRRQQIRRRWEALLAEAGFDLREADRERPEEHAHALLPELRRALDWPRAWASCAQNLEAASIPWPKLLGRTCAEPPHAEVWRISKCARESVLPGIAMELERRRREELALALHRCKAVLAHFKRLPAAAEAARALEAHEPEAYATAVRELKRLQALRVPVQRRHQLLAHLAKKASAWAEFLEARHPRHAGPEVPGNPSEAWMHRQLAQELDRRAGLDADALQRELSNLKDQLHQVNSRLVENLAWGAQARRTDPSQHRALTAFVDEVNRLGKGTVKHAAQRRLAARKHLAQARGAVPVWIMPMARVAESFLPGEKIFDVVILDEASQCDLSALVAFALGRQVVVVGDDEQVTPLDIGMSIDEVRVLQEEWLQGFADRNLFDGKASAYEIGRRAFPGGLIRLVEHFRCVPDIIAFSNELSYKWEIRPLRESSSGRVFPSVVAHRVSQGQRSADTKINRLEALEIASLVVAMTRLPAYEGLSIGVISMLGEEQARDIDALLQRTLELGVYKGRRIVVGTAAHFQGDERDVMLLSLVDSGEEGPLRLLERDEAKKRYNVAASRARDQMWVVHSLDHEKDLKPGDIRKKLLEHALNPSRWRSRLADEQRTDSEFERLVLRRLRDKGYLVRPQLEVGAYSIDLVVQGRSRQVAIECDGERFHTLENLDQDLARQAILERLGWRFIRIRGSAFFRNPDREMERVYSRLDELGIERGVGAASEPAEHGVGARDGVIRLASELRQTWLAEAGSLEELFAQAAPPRRVRTFGARAVTTGPVDPVHDAPARVKRVARLAEAADQRRVAERPAVAPVLLDERPASQRLTSAILGNIPDNARVCPRCGRRLELLVEKRGIHLICQEPTCVARQAAPLKAIQDAAKQLGVRCECGAPVRIVEYGPSRFVGCSTHPRCKKNYQLGDLVQRIGAKA